MEFVTIEVVPTSGWLLSGIDWWYVEDVIVIDNTQKAWKADFHKWISIRKYKVHCNYVLQYELGHGGSRDRKGG